MHRIFGVFWGSQTARDVSAIVIQKAYRAHRSYERQKMWIAMRFPKSRAKRDVVADRHVSQDLDFWEEQRALIRRIPRPACDGFEFV